MTKYKWQVMDTDLGTLVASGETEFPPIVPEKIVVASLGDIGGKWILEHVESLPVAFKLQIINVDASKVIYEKAGTKADVEKFWADVKDIGTGGGGQNAAVMDLSWLLYVGLGFLVVVVIYWAYRRLA